MLKMLSREIKPTQGSAFIEKMSILDSISSVRKCIGSCSQMDSLFQKMTVKEHLILYGRLKGVSGKELKTLVKNMIRVLDIEEHKNKIASSLSGGNKRKLCGI